MASEFTLCPACGKLFVDPVTLNCFHTFCLKCMTNTKGKYICSLCDKEQSQEGQNCFKKDNFMETFCDVIRMERKLSDVCFSCSESSAVNYCFNCQKSYCVDCSKQHQLECNNTHKILPFTSVLECGFDRRKSQPDSCGIHHLDVSQFCMTCKKLVCGDCVISGHKGHWCLPTQKALTQCATDIKRTAKSLKNFHQQIHKQTMLVLEYLSLEEKRIEIEIKLMFESIRKVLDEREKLLIENIKLVFDKEKKILEEQEKTSSKMCSSASAASSKLTFINKYGTATEMLSYHSKVKDSELSTYIESNVQLLPKAVVYQSSSLMSEIDTLLERLNCAISYQRGDYVKRLLNSCSDRLKDTCSNKGDG
ncbi:transcription intermediary factor 1-beta-like [Saccostrea echinata]|uniref:transcription intermediary factor 1-beta-like n=1 Tax=Saccostrea echinata TaxID=191078 RepID=UPI002A823B82|nr:transcription intermediary factor 1-beta-like [Saccostrea echinata]